MEKRHEREKNKLYYFACIYNIQRMLVDRASVATICICITHAQYVLLMLKFQWMRWTLNIHMNRCICQCETHFSSSSLFNPHLVTQIFGWFRYIFARVQYNQIKVLPYILPLVVWSRFIFVPRREGKRHTKWNKCNNKKATNMDFEEEFNTRGDFSRHFNIVFSLLFILTSKMTEDEKEKQWSAAIFWVHMFWHS